MWAYETITAAPAGPSLREPPRFAGQAKATASSRGRLLSRHAGILIRRDLRVQVLRGLLHAVYRRIIDDPGVAH